MKNIFGALVAVAMIALGCMTMKEAWQSKEDYWAIKRKGVEGPGEIVNATRTKSEKKLRRHHELTVRYGPAGKPMEKVFSVPEDLYFAHAAPPAPQIVNGVVLPWPHDLITQKKVRVSYLPEHPLTAMLVGVEPNYEGSLYLSVFIILLGFGAFLYYLLGGNRFSRGGI